MDPIFRLEQVGHNAEKGMRIDDRVGRVLLDEFAELFGQLHVGNAVNAVV